MDTFFETKLLTYLETVNLIPTPTKRASSRHPCAHVPFIVRWKERNHYQMVNSIQVVSEKSHAYQGRIPDCASWASGSPGAQAAL